MLNDIKHYKGMILLKVNKYKEVLTSKGIKNTRSRNAVLEILQNSEIPLTAEEIFLMLKQKNVLTCLSTVYRTFEMLMLKGIIIKSNIFDDGKARYELKHVHHKHYVICIGCHKTITIEECPFGEFEKLLKKKIDFDVTEHKFEIYGYCQNCKQLK